MKLALLGYGFMGGAHLAAIQRIDGVTVKSVSSRTRPSNPGPTRGNLNLKSGPLPGDVVWHPDWREILKDPEIDAVDVCLPTDLHKEVVLAALSAGKHVFCEKPMAIHSEDCDVILAAAEVSGHIFMVGQVLRFMYPYRYAADFIKEVGHDAVSRCVLRRRTGYPDWGGWLGKEERSGGAILDLLSHDLDQALSLFGAPKWVRAVSQGPVDTMKATLQYEDGFVVQVEGGWFVPDVPFSASFEIEAGGRSLSFRDGALRRRDENGTDHLVEIPEQDPYFDEIFYFIDCCRRNVLPAICLPTESAAAVRLSNLLKASRDANGKEIAWKM
ncbi:Gfo/Idh/MocA family protein [Edaphobacter modestus]|uniref:Putative dehydrogenase n=1 Tax=Edaphobacter modestus TaxID=388466 RepID=A0A4Q7YQN3_9BACT|nr:Gfo/Idh/MocA family oxidoreductase [Edaphobacter modestus]RZU39095.1 putative dehydrogenase [Edaphobacter modestus]